MGVSEVSAIRESHTLTYLFQKQVTTETLWAMDPA